MDASKPAESAESPLPSPSDVATYEWRWSWPARVGFLFTGVAVPVFCFSAGAAGLAANFWSQPWQSGSPRMYIGLLLGWKASSIVYPFLIYSMASMALLVVRPVRFSKMFVIRFGIFTGVWIALQYSVICWIFFFGYPSWAVVYEEGFALFYVLLAVFAPWSIVWLVHRLAKKHGRVRVWSIAVVLGFVGWTLFLQFSPDGRGDVGVIFERELEFLHNMSLMLGTPWALAAYSTMAWYLVYRLKGDGPRLQFGLLRMFGVLSWLAAYMGAWRASVNIMLAEYAQLPTEIQGCYVTTAAARGHRCVVRSDAIRIGAGVRHVNNQMRYLKCGELVLRHVAPRGHRLCRGLYDRLGPPMASLVVHPLLADVVYFLFKPAEWLVRCALALLLHDHKHLVMGIYRDKG